MQRPRVALTPDSTAGWGREAVELAAMAGLHLDEWQAFVLEHALAERADGRWASRDVGLCVPRQNGKGSILEARELAGLFLLGERLIIHSAHEFATSREAQRRLEDLILDTQEFKKRVKAVRHAHGDESIELTSGQRIQFRTRTKGGGRGFSADCVMLDEAMILPEKAFAALLPTLSARPNPQVWFTGSAVDQTVHEYGVVFARVRERGLRGDERIAYFEWSAYPDGMVEMDPADAHRLAGEAASVEAANPSLGIRIQMEDVESERRSLDPRSFAVERLGIGDWPATDPDAGSIIPMELWRGLTDTGSSISERLCFAVDTNPERSSTSIAAAGLRRDELAHVEIIERHPGTGWVIQRLVELQKHAPSAVLCDANGPVASLVEDAAAAGVVITPVTGPELARACGSFFDLATEHRLRHLGSQELDTAIRGAAKRPLVDSWAWSRKSSKVDISPLVAATLAAWHATSHDPNPFIL